MMAGDEAQRAIERVARASYGRLLALLAARARDVAAAEDALGDGLVAALRTWPRDGVPSNPEAWLLTAARNSLTDAHRHRRVVAAREPELLRLLSGAPKSPEAEFPDERLKLLFVCTHPAIAPDLRAPLMLQTVLGLDAAAIAPAFLVAPATMSQRLVRAKARIRDAGLRFAIPAPQELPARLDAVLEAVYAAFGLGWDRHSLISPGASHPSRPGRLGTPVPPPTPPAGRLPSGRSEIGGMIPDASGPAPGPAPNLEAEALWIARDLHALLPNEPEVLGLLALLLYCHARRSARRTPTGAYVPLGEQDIRLWDQTLIAEAEYLLARAAAHRRLGRFQLEAAIQSVHSARARTGRTQWAAIAGFYARLVHLAPSIGARTAHAAATAEATGPAAGLALLDAIASRTVTGYQPYWAVRGHLLGQLGRRSEARAAFDLAIKLSPDPAVRGHLQSKSRALARHLSRGPS